MKKTLSLPKPLHQDLIPDVNSKFTYVHEGIAHAEVSADGTTLCYEIADPALEQVVQERLLTVVAKMSRGFRPRRAKALREIRHHNGKALHACDATGALAAEAAIKEELTGAYQFGPLPAALSLFFVDEIRKIAIALGAQPHAFPTLIAPEVLRRAGYFKAFPHSLCTVSHVRSDLERIEQFSAEARKDFARLSVETLSPPKALLSPAVCFHLYDFLRARRLTAPYIGYALGKCFRYEAGNLSGLERQWDFSMFEIMTVGTQERVLQMRSACEEALTELLAAMRVSHEVVVATDPFFVGEYGAQAGFQSAFELKHEIRADLPKTQKTLAIGSYNYHQDHFGRAFDILSEEGGPAHTGCSAFGIERWVCAFIAQHGPEPGHWPDAVRQGIERYR